MKPITTFWLPGQNTRIKNAFQPFTPHCSRGGTLSQRKLRAGLKAAAGADLRATSFVAEIQPIRNGC
jgi:hypothetical protein